MEISPYASEMRNVLKTLDKSKKIELLNFHENEEFYVLHFSVNSYPVKLTTNFDSYCYFESEILDVKELNYIFLDNQKNSSETIVTKLQQFLNMNSELDTSIETIQDKFHIYQKIEEISKALINYELVEKESKTLRDSKTSVDISKFPKELLFNPNQIYQIIVQEIKQINKNTTYKHFIEPIKNNPYSLRFVCFLNNKNFKSETFEMKINLEPKLYPFFPPRIEIIKPSMKLPLVHSLMNLKLLKLENWNPTLSLEWLLTSLVEQIEPIVHEYVKSESTKFQELEILLVKLSSLTKEYSSEKEIINISATKVNITSNEISNGNDSKFWKSGVGYGNDSRKAWDISSFIKEQEIFNFELAILLRQIVKHMTNESKDELFGSSLPTFLINRIRGLTLLELEKTKDVYVETLNILDKISKLEGVDQNFINDIGSAFNVISDEIMSLFTSRPETQEDETYLKIHCVSDWFKSRIQTKQVIPTSDDIISVTSDKKKDYEEIMKKLQFGTFEIQSNHRFKEYISQKPEQKAIMRMISEVSTFKTGLPLNWESTVWARVSKSSMNVFSFFISGPKDTPYENGIFEFHSAFPSNYPNSEPKVLINTTGGGSIRFNPNLYNCGKVCLSLLGTWSGQEGEKWNPKTSTFLQVIVSIQSLILVENPYFNEPGWERDMHTTAGQTRSKEYNEPLQIGTIKWAINDMLKNPPNGMEEVIKNHFKFKKDEILATTQKWLNEISTKHRGELEQARNDMVSLFNTL
jgi:ubiquitin-protein ligase